ncbi:sulfite exporter TauE/SafE family protein [Hoeflea prorocentri]|uniref:Probable membrane transporter protein n=1 Tax=Hoeflea prorocentri TaxID=1922333 RepID=A0A9X3UFZ2_9HYPH|nr:sulfite exporter TauE/SafE family protein [Hoeflea prorocentri]MCY6379899.1 sulfite exporter TauE/SafE family protein [Hoeflea prorocentri]MDA5397699.1 sulfite exporter TauE/SafE family protein [Hoeflea prorocentri]
MELSHSLLPYVIANCAVVIASLVQTSTGMGFAMIAAPLLALVSLEFVPGPMLFVNLFLSLFMLGDGRSHIVRREIVTLCPTILIGTLIGAAILTGVPGDSLAILFASLVLLAVAISLFAKAQPLTTRNLSICGVAAGAMGSTSGIPGAPLVIMYQNEPLEKTRPTMALVFTFTYITSLVALAYAGAFNFRLAMDGLMLLPGLLIGFAIGRWARQYMTQAMGRILMLSIASTGAILLLIKSSVG